MGFTLTTWPPYEAPKSQRPVRSVEMYGKLSASAPVATGFSDPVLASMVNAWAA